MNTLNQVKGKEVKKMNTVLELQKLAHDTDGKGPAVEATITTTWTVTTTSGFVSSVSNHC
ncbi:class III lanthipeptide [Bacillus atrophaeus]|uniref:class III lanthipeptide n=1 Tax=Bacillus atrophaeus TaxID=1452 RepID=UPI002DBF44A2|nr:class III lanthipeptide [Bacillus atrophaeus]